MQKCHVHYYFFYIHLGYPFNFIFVFHSHVMGCIPLPSRGKVGKKRSTWIIVLGFSLNISLHLLIMSFFFLTSIIPLTFCVFMCSCSFSLVHVHSFATENSGGEGIKPFYVILRLAALHAQQYLLSRVTIYKKSAKFAANLLHIWSVQIKVVSTGTNPTLKAKFVQ